MAGHFDVIVIGAGHNGLTTACLLARAGRSVLVIEKRAVVGGLCAPEEFHPGYHAPGILHDTAQLRTGLLEDLHLDEHGLDLTAPEPTLFVSPSDHTGVLISLSDPTATAAEITRVSERDSVRWGQYRAFISRARDLIEPLLADAPPDLARLGSMGPGALGGLPLTTVVHLANAARRFGRNDLPGLLRIPPMCVADWLNEWFESDVVKGGLANAAIQGMWAGPWSPGTAANLLLLECTTRHSVVGGAAGLASALERAARQYGVKIRTEAEVTRIRLENRAVAGVTLKSGEAFDARVVASGVDPRTTFLRLIEPATLPIAFEHRIGVLRARGTSAKVHLALSRRLEFAAKPGERIARARTTGSLDDLERAFDPVKYRGASERPLLDIFIPSVARPETAPDGTDVVSLLVHFAPFDLAGGWTSQARERLGDAAIAELERVAPGVSKSIVARQVLTPADLAERFGIVGGHIHHLEPALDQLVIRPTLETMRYATPVRGLFLCGAGSHPGGGVTCAPGALAADAVVGRELIGPEYAQLFRRRTRFQLRPPSAGCIRYLNLFGQARGKSARAPRARRRQRFARDNGPRRNETSTMPRSIVQPTGFISPKLEGRLIGTKGGRGVFAREKVRAKEVLVVWGGEVVTGEMLADMSDDKHRVSIQIEEDLYLVTANEGPADWVNHSCDPNGGLVGQVVLVALRDIRVGEEISFDYATSDGSPYDEFECHCSAKTCRHHVSADDWKLPALAVALRRALLALRPATDRRREASARRRVAQARARG